MMRQEDGVSWAVESLHMHYKLFIFSKDILFTQRRNLSKIANIPTAIAWREEPFTVAKQSFMSYVWASREDYAVRFGGVCIISIVDELMFPSCLTANSRIPYVSCIIAWNMVVKHIDVHPLLMNQGNDALLAKSLGTTLLDEWSYYI